MYKHGERFEHRFSGFKTEEAAGAWLEDVLADFYFDNDPDNWETTTSIGRNHYGSWYAEYSAVYVSNEG